jgi:hypothetical protein
MTKRTSPSRGLFGDPQGLQQRGELPRHSRKGAGGLPLARLQRLPVAHDLAGIGHVNVAEHMGVAVHHLGVYLPTYLLDIEPAVLARELRREDDLKQQVTELPGQRGSVTLVDRVHDLVRLFDDVGLQGFQRLFPVPRAAIGRTEALRECDQRIERVFPAHERAV